MFAFYLGDPGAESFVDFNGYVLKRTKTRKTEDIVWFNLSVTENEFFW